MNINDAETIRESIDQVISAAQNLESQSEQLNNVRESVGEYVQCAGKINEQLLNLSGKVEDHIKACDHVVLSGYAEQLATELSKSEELLTHIRETVEGITVSYQEELNTLTSEHGAYEETIKGIVKDVTDNLREETSKFDNLEKDFQAFKAEISTGIADESASMKEAYKTFTGEISTSLTNKIDPLQEDFQKYKAEISSNIAEDVNSLKNSFDTFKKDISTDITDKFVPLQKDFQTFKTEISSNISDKIDIAEKNILQAQASQNTELINSFENSKTEILKEMLSFSADLSQHVDSEKGFNVILQKQCQDTYEKTVKLENQISINQESQKADLSKLIEATESLKSDLKMLKERKTYNGLIISTFVFSLISMLLSVLGYIAK